MVLEVAILNVRPGETGAFEAAFRDAQRIIAACRGHRRHELRHCVEAPDRYLLLVWWDTLEDHTRGFRESPEYQRWRELLHHFYDPFPTVEHYVAVEDGPEQPPHRRVEGERRSAKPIRRRPFDLLLTAFFCISVLYGFLFSLPEGIGVPVSADSPWPPLRALHDWAVAEEPAHLDPPPNLIAACLFDGFFQAPVLLFVIVGLVRQRDWLRPLGLVYAGAATTNMFFYFTQTFLGPHPPPNTFYYLVFNLPWLLAPLALGVRVLRGRDLAAG